jgi:hypothetical protein
MRMKILWMDLSNDKVNWRTPKLFDKLNCNSKCENNGRMKSSGMLFGSQHFGGRGAC